MFGELKKERMMSTFSVHVFKDKNSIVMSSKTVFYVILLSLLVLNKSVVNPVVMYIYGIYVGTESVELTRTHSIILVYFNCVYEIQFKFIVDV